MAEFFKVQMGFKRLPLEEPVHFKVDGARFALERTVKLNINARYALEVTFTPPKKLEDVTLQGTRVDAKRISQACSPEADVYRASWSTAGMEKSKKGVRHTIPVVFIIEGATLKVNLQVKFYSEKEKEHSHWGSMVNNLDWECKRLEGAGFIDILSDTIR